MLLLIKPKTLPVCHGGIPFVLFVGEGSRDGRLDPSFPIPQRLMPLNWQNRQEALNQSHHSTCYLHTGCPAKTNFIQGKTQKVLPGRKRNDEPQCALVVPIMPDFQITAAEPGQEVLNLIQGLYRGC